MSDMDGEFENTVSAGNMAIVGENVFSCIG